MFFKKKPKDTPETLENDYDKALQIAIAALNQIISTPTQSKSTARANAAKAIDQIKAVRNQD